MADETTVRTEMNFIVGSSAGGKKGSTNFDLGHELNLVKAALLYADRVELVSIGASILYGFVALAEIPPEKRLALVREHAPSNVGYRLTEEELQKIDLVLGTASRRQRRAISKRQLDETRKQLQAVVDEVWQQIKRDTEERFNAYNARGLEEAVGSGLLELQAFQRNIVEGMLSMATEDFTVDVAVEEIVAEYVQRASIAIEGPGYPLFDDLVGYLVNQAVRDGLIDPSPAAVHRGRHAGLAGDLLGRLPLFEEASVSDVLEIRSQLEAPLGGFRRAVAEFSRDIHSTAWDPGFVGEADVLFREKVEPEIERIGEAVAENRSYSELVRGVARRGGVTRAVLGAALGQASDVSALAGVVLGLGTAGVQALVDQRDRSRALETNQLYFYYGAREAQG